MQLLLKKLNLSVKHLKCLDKIFREECSIYAENELKMRRELGNVIKDVGRELYAGGKTKGNAHIKMNRQMILGDIIEYIISGRAHYYAAESAENQKNYMKLVFYIVNQLLLFDTITIKPNIRKKYLMLLEATLNKNDLYEKEGDKSLAEDLKYSNIVIWEQGWDKYDNFVDSLLPKTLGTPKELIVFIELIRLRVGLVIPLLLIQRLFNGENAIAPPDFLVLKRNKEIFGIEVGYNKEGQSREFNLKTSIPTFGVDLADHMHNRCPKCGENILYCDEVINDYVNGTLWGKLDDQKRYICGDCPKCNQGMCLYANYYGKYEGDCFYGAQKAGDGKQMLHYHAKCVIESSYKYRNKKVKIKDLHLDEIFAQYPKIEGIDEII